MMENKIYDFNLYHTLGCHLCDEAEKLIIPIFENYHLNFEKIDISINDSLIDQYGIRIPVLHSIKTKAELGWPFDREQLLIFLTPSKG